MKKLIFVIAMGLLTPSAFAGPQGGDSQVGIFGALISTDYSDTLLLGASYNIFIMDSLSAGVNISGLTSDDFDNINMQGEVNWYFVNGESMGMYLGGGVGVNSIASDTIDDSYGLIDLHVGMEQFIDERTSLDYRLAFQSIDTDPDASDQVILTVGFKRYF